MTIIAYSSKHRVMAADTRITASGTIMGQARKISRLRNGALFGSCGEVDTRDIEALLGKASPSRLPSRTKLGELEQEVIALLVFKTGLVARIAISYDNNAWRGELALINSPYYAVGSGADVAYGAMAAGATPKRAVEIVCERDNGCGLPADCEAL